MPLATARRQVRELCGHILWREEGSRSTKSAQRTLRISKIIWCQKISPKGATDAKQRRKSVEKIKTMAGAQKFFDFLKCF
jgi:hypothetical protein